MGGLGKFLVVAILFWSIQTFAAEQEAIFIESISELSGGRITRDEIRTRPTTVSPSAKTFSIEINGYYIAGTEPPESRYVAEDRARADARRLASEQASLYIRAVSTSNRGKLTRDEVHTISATVIQIISEDVSTEVVDNGQIQYRCYIRALFDEASIFSQLNSADKDKFAESVRRAIEVERENARLNTELVALKEKYRTASASEREKISAEVKRNEEQFEAVQLNALGYIANYQQDFDAAIDYCYKAVEFMPNYAAAWNNLGYAYTYKGTFERAIECYQRAIELAPNDAAPLINLGNIYDELKNFDAAIEYYQRALTVAPDYANTWNSLGYAFIQKGDFDKGIEYCGKAVELDKHYAAAWNGLGYAYNRKQKFYKAIECCRKAVGLNKNYANAWNNLGYACSKVNRFEDSYAAYRNAVKIAPNIQLYKNNLAIAQERLSSFKSL